MAMPLRSVDLYLWHGCWICSDLLSLCYCFRVEEISLAVSANFKFRVGEISAVELGLQLKKNLTVENFDYPLANWEELVDWCLCCRIWVGDIPTTEHTSIRNSYGYTPISRVWTPSRGYSHSGGFWLCWLIKREHIDWCLCCLFWVGALPQWNIQALGILMGHQRGVLE